MVLWCFQTSSSEPTCVSRGVVGGVLKRPMCFGLKLSSVRKAHKRCKIIHKMCFKIRKMCFKIRKILLLTS